MKKTAKVMSIIFTAIFLCACSGGSGGDNDAAPLTDGDSVLDTDINGDEDAPVVNDNEGQDDEVVTTVHGFSIRKPGKKNFSCKNDYFSEDMEFPGGDHLCTFTYKELNGFLYFRATATGCTDNGMSFGAAYETIGWISFNDKAEALEKPLYDWGGNHQNDSFSFVYKGTPYTLFHSTFGPGWRKCQPMDCIKVFKSDNTILEDGCTEERTLPATCVRINEDGTVPPLPETFTPC